MKRIKIKRGWFLSHFLKTIKREKQICAFNESMHLPLSDIFKLYRISWIK